MADGNTLPIPLSKSYPTVKGEISELVLREPTARDYLQIPLPLKQVKRNGGTESSLDFTLMFQWASRLSNTEIGVLELFNKADTWALASVIGGWIGADEDGVDEKNSES